MRAQQSSRVAVLMPLLHRCCLLYALIVSCRRLWFSGNFIITIAAIVCSTIALFIKQLHGTVPAVEITLISSCLSWLLTTAWLFLVGENFSSLFRCQVPLLFVRGALGAAPRLSSTTRAYRCYR